MRIHAYFGTVAHDFRLAIEQHRSRSRVGIDGIDQDDGFSSREFIDDFESRRSQVGDFNARFEIIAGGQKTRHIGADAIVSQQDAADAADQNVSHSTFTLAICRPDGSKVWQAQAMQGSNECTVRRTSSGSSGLASGVCSSEASYGP